tara:strand:- start:1914 stop:2672 length:759 start_codon:yes stop_codon:yes gene_type:complete
VAEHEPGSKAAQLRLDEKLLELVGLFALLRHDVAKHVVSRRHVDAAPEMRRHDVRFVGLSQWLRLGFVQRTAQHENLAVLPSEFSRKLFEPQPWPGIHRLPLRGNGARPVDLPGVGIRSHARQWAKVPDRITAVQEVSCLERPVRVQVQPVAVQRVSAALASRSDAIADPGRDLRFAVQAERIETGYNERVRLGRASRRESRVHRPHSRRLCFDCVVRLVGSGDLQAEENADQGGEQVDRDGCRASIDSHYG